MPTNRNSVWYNQIHVNKYLATGLLPYGREVVPIPFKHTIVSGETGGASAGVRDTVNLCVIPAYYTVIGLTFVAENIWASAGTNGTFQIGDSGDDDRYMIATELYTAAGSPITADGKAYGAGVLAFAGLLYQPTSDTIVLGEYRAANPVVGKILKGVFRTLKP